MPETTVLEISFSQQGGAILYYEYDFVQHRGEAARTKEAFQEITTTPTLTPLFLQSDALLEFVQQHSSSALQQFQQSSQAAESCSVTKAILYSAAGFAKRQTVKSELESKMETRNLRLCCATCCCAICCAGCCKCCRDFADAEQVDLNEDSYCRILKERFPEQTEETNHEFRRNPKE